jgi:transposase
MVLVDGQGVPLGVCVAAASLAEITLAERTLAAVRVPRWRGTQRPHPGPGRPRTKPVRLIADRAYDCRALWERLQQRGIDLIVPHRRKRRHRWQDGRKLRRYRHRWIIERTNAWLHSFRRLVTRYERRADIYLAFVHVACMLIALRRF